MGKVDLTEERLAHSKRFRRALKALGLTQAAMAREMGVDRCYVHDLVSGRKRVSNAFARYLELKFGLGTTWLVAGEGEMWVRPRPSPTEASAAEVIDLPLLNEVVMGDPRSHARWNGAKQPTLGALLKPATPNSAFYVLNVPDAKLFSDVCKGDLLLVENLDAPLARGVDWPCVIEGKDGILTGRLRQGGDSGGYVLESTTGRKRTNLRDDGGPEAPKVRGIVRGIIWRTAQS